MRKKGEIDFSVLLAIIIGAVILVLAIYGAVKGVGNQNFRSNTEAAKELQNLMNPLQAGFADKSKNSIDFNSAVDIRNVCDNFTGIGSSSLSMRAYVAKGEPKDYSVSVKSSHYIFSKKEMTNVKTLYTYSSSFKLPYDVADYILLISSNDKYCFENAPDSLSFLEQLNYPMFYFEDCAGDYENYFQIIEGSGQGIQVYGECLEQRCSTKYDYGYVQRLDGERVYYNSDSLVPAIFADVSIYNCVMDRLFERAELLTNLYSDKAVLMSGRGCTTNMGSNLQYFRGELDSRDFISVFGISKNLERLNLEGNCRLW